MNNQEIGHLYKFQGGLLGDRFLGGTIVMAQQILQGGYANPTQAQQAWAAAVAAASDVTGC